LEINLIEEDSSAVTELSWFWTQFNYSLFKGVLKAPVFGLSTSLKTLGQWRKSERAIYISESLVINEPWGVVCEVLKHEMAHQYVDEVLGGSEKGPHGKEFQFVCQRLGISGKATGTPHTSASFPHSVANIDKDVAVIRKVKALMSLANSDNVHEARNAARVAKRLMLEHNLANIERTDYVSMHLGKVRKRTPSHERLLAGILGEHFFVNPMMVFSWERKTNTRGRVLEITGLQENVSLAEHVYLFVLGACERLWRSHRESGGEAGSRGRTSFLQGVIIGFDEQLRSESEAAEQEGLVWVGDPDLAKFTKRRYPRMVSGRGVRTAVLKLCKKAGLQV